MASGPETPGLACLMFSIPKRLPTPAPAWEPRAVETGKQPSQLTRPRTGPGSGEGRGWGERCSEQGRWETELPRPQQERKLVQLESSSPGVWECLSSPGTSSGAGAGPVESSSGPASESEPGLADSGRNPQRAYSWRRGWPRALQCKGLERGSSFPPLLMAWPSQGF